MTAKQLSASRLEELLGKVTQGECKFSSVTDGDEWFGCSVSIGDREVLWMEDDPETDEPIAQLFALSPSLARCVIAAEKLVDELSRICSASGKDAIAPLIAAYREISS